MPDAPNVPHSLPLGQFYNVINMIRTVHLDQVGIMLAMVEKRMDDLGLARDLTQNHTHRHEGASACYDMLSIKVWMEKIGTSDFDYVDSSAQLIAIDATAKTRML